MRYRYIFPDISPQTDRSSAGLWQGHDLPTRSHTHNLAYGDGSGISEYSRTYVSKQAPEAAIALLESEIRTLQANLEAERERCAILRQALQKQCLAANLDPLTGLCNRRTMDQRLNSLWDGPAPLSVLMLDIDHFKRINDTFGHACGDLVLRQVAEALRRCLRAEDCAFRYGGEEFMVLLPNTPLAGALSVAESIRGRVEALQIPHRENGSMHCTVSLGVASRQDRDNRDSLFQRADRALYQAKQRGRNRVVHEIC
jgi:diguanylate cyclase